jgi:hypothetical protein
MLLGAAKHSSGSAVLSSEVKANQIKRFNAPVAD